MSDRNLNLNPGERIADFQVERMLSLSDRSAVYLVSDLNLDTRFVLKECLPGALVYRNETGQLCARPGLEAAHDQALSDFAAACRLQARLEHPHIPRLLRYFELNGSAYGLMEWLPGETLEALVGRAGRRDTEQTRTIIDALADALDSLHDNDLLHLALAPSNVYLCDNGRVLLLDFVAAARHQAGQKPGTGQSAWQAPETVTEASSPARSIDIFGLCSLAYYCLTGTAPVSAKERLDVIESGSADPLPTVTSQVSSDGLGGLADAIDLGLRLDPERRPATLGQWRQAYESIDWRRRVVQEQDPATQPERPDWLSPLLLGAFLALVIAATAYLFFGREPVTPSESVEPADITASIPAIPEEETRQWQAALQADTVDGYQRFLESYPQSSYSSQAQIQLDILDERVWQALSEEDSLSAYRAYLDQFPAGIHQAEALKRIDRIEQALSAEERKRIERERQDNRAWQTARETGTIAALETYLEAWPAGLHAEAARELRATIRNRELEARAWDAAVQLNTEESYRSYLDAYPNGEHSAEALISLEHLDLGPGKTFRDCDVCPAMVVLPAGQFQQGSRADDPAANTNEQPRRTVNIAQAFAIGVHEVTFEQWDACVADGGCRHQPADNDWGRGDRPVIMVSWNDAQEYVAWLSELTRQDYRLPSESEWEYAARAGEEGPWLGQSPAALCRFANIAGAETTFRWRLEECSDEWPLGTLPVGSRARNGFGLQDIIGNVAEWTADCMNISYVDAPTDGSAWNRGICSSHMTRGGSWVTGRRESRLPARFQLDSGDRNDFTGFRVVRSVKE